ncbi:MAG TPA: hypothetical protein VGY30_11180 [Solirubrobacteraceae bacterium]|jgi:hypothetical protein|nr:hypothetical protein [Solirubrobacteraceae bacterium]
MEYGSANPHLNVFEPYRELGRSHEDQLTRAAMIVLRLVPMAREALLQAIGEPSQSRLPDCVVDMQATNLVDPSEESAAGGEVERERLVSVFLTPDTEPVDISPEITEIDRGQRFDGVLRFDPELVVVLESKVCRRWARRDGKRVAELNLGGTHFAKRRTCVLRWHDLLESWWRLVELGVLAPAEQAIVGDVLSYAHQDFGELLPYGTLRRVGKDPVRRKWRLRSLLAEASGIAPERAGLVHIRVDTALGAVTLQRAALQADEESLTLHLWPGELKAQAEQLYAGGRAERLCELLGTDGDSWVVRPQPLLGFRNAPVRTRVYLTCELDPGEYARRWQGEDWKQVGAHHRSHIRERLWPWLLERGYATAADEARIDPFLRALGRRFAHLRPSMHVQRTWEWLQAERLDDEGLLAGEIHAALDRVLALLDEPPLASETGGGEGGAAVEQEPVDAVVAS